MSTLFKDTIVYETYGEAISIGDILYKSTGTGNDSGRDAGRLYKLDMNTADRNVFYGIAKESGGPADINKKVVTSGKFDGLSSLTPGQPVYADPLNPGQVTQTRPNRKIQVIGIAIDADSISVNAALGGSAGAGEGVGGGSSNLNLLEDPSFEFQATEGSVIGTTASLNTVTVLPTPNNKSSLELNFNNVTGSYILEKNTGAQYDGVQGIISVWIKTAKTGVTLIPRINGADSTALEVAVKSDNKWNEYVIPAVIGTTSFGFKVNVPTSNAGSIFIDEATVGAMPSIGAMPAIGGGSPLTTKGDIYARDASTDARLPVGTNGQLLSVNSATATGLEWVAPPSTSPLTTKGDLFGHNGSTNVRVPVGSNGQMLFSNSATASGLQWGAPINETRFDANGTYTPSPNARYLIVEAVGGGGGKVSNGCSGISVVGGGGVRGVM
jgi:hypothetical protein